MTAAHPGAATPAARPSFDLKSAQLPVMAVVLRDVAVADVAADLAHHLADDPGFFDGDPVMLDLRHVQDNGAGDIDFPGLVELLRGHGARVVAVRGGSPAQADAARAAGLVHLSDAARPSTPVRETVKEIIREVVREVPVEVVREVVREVTRELPVTIVDKPLRSGQQVYARDGDLVVLAVVSYGAEVIADGSIHVYAPLRGRAVAGARGNTAARIFSTCMQPQLLSIAGNYRPIDGDLPPGVSGKPAQARLEDGRLIIEPLPPG